MLTYLPESSGLIAAVITFVMVVFPGVISGTYKTNSPISIIGESKTLGSIFTSGVILSGIFQAIYITFLADTMAQTESQRLSLLLYVVGCLLCIGIGLVPLHNYPTTHELLTKGYFLIAILSAFAFQIHSIGQLDLLGLVLTATNILGTFLMVFLRKNKTWTEVLAVTLLVAWNLHFYIISGPV